MIGKSTFRSLTLEHLDPAQWYGILFAIGCAMWPLFRLASRLLRSAWAWASNFFLKHFCYPHLYRRAIWASPVTRAQFLLILMYVAINTVAMTLGTDAAAQVSSRSGVLATFNLIALLAGSRFSSVAGCFGISLRVYTILHKWIGRMAILQAFTHTALSISRWRSNILGLVATGCLGFIGILSLTFFRRSAYEFFLGSHFVLSVVVAYALQRHLSSAGVPIWRLLYGVLGIWLVLTLHQLARYVFLNFVPGRPFATTTMIETPDAVQINVTVPRAWKVRAGQYVYLWFPTAGFWSPFQSHPFMVTWWEEVPAGLVVWFLVESREGFTRKLLRYTSFNLMTFLGGPYGQCYDFGSYGTVLMFASGIGIAGHMPYLKTLVERYKRREVSTRRIMLIWQLDKEQHQDWVFPWMRDLIMEDVQMVMNVTVYVIGKYNDHRTNFGDEVRWGQRAHYIYEPPNITSVLEEELVGLTGKMAVSVCADRSMRDEVREAVHQNFSPQLRLFELEFQPSPRRPVHKAPPKTTGAIAKEG